MFTTPGVYFQEADRSRPAIGALRTDIAGFVGYAERGPLGYAVKVQSRRQFATVFGQALAFGFLGEAVGGFFDNGGTACYVVRLANDQPGPGGLPDTAAAAAIELPTETPADPVLRFWASFGEILDPVTGTPRIEDGQPLRVDNPGVWGNRLAVSLAPAGLGTAETTGAQGDDAARSYVSRLDGFQAGSVVRLTQTGAATAYRRIDALDARLREIVWNEPLAGFDRTAPIRLETLEFSLTVFFDGQIVGQHANLSLSPAHDRYAVTRLQEESPWLDLELRCDGAPCPDAVLDAPASWQDAERWAEVDRAPLTGGRDGLSTVGTTHFLRGLDALAAVDEVSLLLAPDLVATPQPPQPVARAVAAPVDCDVPEPPPEGQLRGVVLEQRGDAPIPLAGVEIRTADGRAVTTSAADGTFALTSLPLGSVSLVLSKPGYAVAEVSSEARRLASRELPFFLAPLTLPPTFSLDEVFDVQEAMIRQGAIDGLYRVAVLDAPAAVLDAEGIQQWRARFDTAFAALYFPWIQVEAGGGAVRAVPPGGHVAGLIARTDRTHGVHRAPANLVVEGAKALSVVVDDATQGVLNPLGINCLRVLPGRGIRVFGARTLSSDPEWRYLNVRRLVLMIEESIEKANQWVVFEPNTRVVRQALTFSLVGFLNTLWRQGALAGDTVAAAFQVRCDETNNPPDVVDAGQLLAEIAVAPAIPFEFVIIRLGRTVDALSITE